MGGNRGIHAWSITALVVLSVLAVASAGASAQTTWSSPVGIGATGGANAISCPTAAQCTAVDATGHEVTFNPTTKAVNTAGVKTVAPAGQVSVSCPSASQCTAVGGAKDTEVTFDPATGTVNAGGVKSFCTGTGPACDFHDPRGVSCPSTAQCTLIDTGGHEYTFDPRSATLNPAGVQPGGGGVSSPPGAISCPSTTQCTVVSEGGIQTTFDPTTGHHTTSSGRIAGNDGTVFHSVSCPSVKQCTAMFGGMEVTFDPTTGTARGSGLTSVDSTDVGRGLVSCPSTSLCVAVIGAGSVSFDPAAPAGAQRVQVTGAATLAAISCPTTTTCAAVDSSGHAFVGTVTAPPPPPVSATTQRATAVTRTTAVVHGQVDTRGQNVSWQFEFGTSTRYNKGTPVRSIAAGTRNPVSVSWGLRRLTPNTLYHFRVVALVSAGAGVPLRRIYGRDLTFRTVATGKVVVVSTRLTVSRRQGSTRVGLRCVSRLACAASFQITARGTVRTRHGLARATFICSSASVRIRAGRAASVRINVSRGCRSLLDRARRHRISARVAGRARTGQAFIARNITLTL